MKAINFQADIPAITIGNFKEHNLLVFDFFPMQEPTESYQNPKLVEERLRLELTFTHPLEHATELILLGEQTYSVAVDKFGVVGKNT